MNAHELPDGTPRQSEDDGYLETLNERNWARAAAKKIDAGLTRASSFAVDQARRVDEETVLLPSRPSAESMRAFKEYLARPTTQVDGGSNA